MYAGFMGFFTACSQPAVQPGVLWFSPHDPDARLYHWRVAGHLLVQAVRGLHSRASILGKVGPPCHPSPQTYLYCCVLAVYLNKSTPGHCRVSHVNKFPMLSCFQKSVSHLARHGREQIKRLNHISWVASIQPFPKTGWQMIAHLPVTHEHP